MIKFCGPKMSDMQYCTGQARVLGAGVPPFYTCPVWTQLGDTPVPQALEQGAYRGRGMGHGRVVTKPTG